MHAEIEEVVFFNLRCREAGCGLWGAQADLRSEAERLLEDHELEQHFPAFDDEGVPA